MSTAVWITVTLLLLNAFFVGSEFAAMAARRSQLEPLAEAGDRRAQVSLDALNRLPSMLAAAQLGITVCSVLLGAISEAALHHALVPVAEWLHVPERVVDSVALALALLVIIYLHVVIGEMIPKNVAISMPERSAVWLIPPLYAFTRVLGPLISLMERVAKFLVRAMGVEPRDEAASDFTAEEVAHIVDESHREGLVEMDDYLRLGAALQFSDKSARDIGIPVADLVTLGKQSTPAEVERLVAKYGFSRYPVVEEATGALLGYVHMKDVIGLAPTARDLPVPLNGLRRMPTARGTDSLHLLLQRMQDSGSHLARVIDDEAVVAVAFLEDLVEVLIGEVSDATQR